MDKILKIRVTLTKSEHLNSTHWLFMPPKKKS